jgi:phage shock protein A
MGFFDRITNVWRGFLSLWVSNVETKNPEAVYEAAIEERIKQHRDLKKAVSSIVYLRNKTETELEERQKQLAEVKLQLPIAVEEGEDEVALILIQKKDELSSKVAGLQGELEKIAMEAEEAKSSLISYQGEIERLRREKDEMLAKKATAEARIQIQDTLDGLSMEADIKALENVREHIGKLQAEADVGKEVSEEGLDSKLKKIQQKTASASARAQLEEMKRQSEARKTGQAQAAGIKKTM